MRDFNPVFIIGSERSGTNLLRKLLSNHSNISGPKSPHFINTLYNHQRYYGNLKDRKNFKEIFDDFILLANHKFTDWNIKLDFDDFKPETNNVFLELVHFFYSSYAISENKGRYVSKELNAHKVFNEIIKTYPNSKFVHIVRNPLEQVASWMRTPIYIRNPNKAIKRWVETQDSILNLAFLYPNYILTLKYEDVVIDTKNSITSVLNFINENIESDCFENKQEQKGHNWNKLWENVNKPVGNNLNKHKEILTNRDCNMIYYFAESLMKELGYNANTNKKKEYNENIIEKIRLYLYDKRSNRRRKKVKGFNQTRERTKFGQKIKAESRSRYFKDLK
jgi:hypothetical protein